MTRKPLWERTTVKFAGAAPTQLGAATIAALRADPDAPLPVDIAEPARTELRALQQALREALWERAKLEALTATVSKASHDMRGLLSPSLLAAERLQGNEDPSVARVGDMIMQAIDRAAALMREVLDFAQEGRITPVPTRFKLLGVIDEAVAVVLGPETSAIVTVSDAIDLEADQGALLRVFANLLRNAAQARARIVRITASTVPGKILLEIADDGPGLPAQVRQLLFQPFVTGPGASGAGLGLAIARNLLRAGGGDIALAETGPGGTVFVITLPVRARVPHRN